MKFIFALGNPGLEYAKSRHNTGWQLIDLFVEQNSLPKLKAKTKFKAKICEFSVNEEKIIIAKPTTFYNLVGESVRKIIDFYQIPPEDILVLHDDMTLDFGTIRTRLGGSDAGNNGVKSLNAHIGQDFWRLRLGTKNLIKEHVNDSAFVLQSFSKNEQTQLEKTILPEAVKYIDTFLENELQPTSQSLDIPPQS